MDTNYTFKAIAFNIADTDLWGKIIDSNDNLINILGQVKKSYWNNKEELSILIEDIYYL